MIIITVMSELSISSPGAETATHYHISLLKILSVIGDIYPKTLYNLCNTFLKGKCMTKDQMIYLLIFLVVSMCVIIVLLVRKRRLLPLPIDEMEGHDFEYYCADLLRYNGYEDVEVTKGSGDFGVDILMSKGEVTYAVQCKCYDKPIGVKAVQEVYAGKDYYERMVGIVMTNQYFTQPARELASRLKVILWDRDRLKSLADSVEL